MTTTIDQLFDISDFVTEEEREWPAYGAEIRAEEEAEGAEEGTWQPGEDAEDADEAAEPGEDA